MAQTEAQKRAKAKYNAKAYKQLKANIKPDDYALIDTYCSENNISKAQLIVKSIKYCIDNGIDFINSSDVNNDK